MTAPTVTLGVGLGVPEASDFILDDATRGVLDGATYTLASGYTTVTGDGYSISVRRGRWSRLWDAFDAGSASVSVWNHDREYDPSYLLSPYSGYIVPGRPLRVTAGGYDVFTGYVDDIDLSYEVSGQSAATFKATDALGMLGQMQFDAWTSSGVSADTKLAAVCDRSEVAWSTTLREFDAGIEVLQSDSVAWGSNVLNYAQLITRSDLGYLFSAVDGMLTFRNRNAVTGIASVASFGDDGVGIPFVNIETTIGSELLFARVSVDLEGLTAQTATVSDTAAWQTSYGPLRSLSITGTLLATEAQALALANYILDLYDTPRYRVSELEVDLTGLSGAQQSTVLALDVASVVDVTFTPNSVGDPIMQTLVVQGIAHNISVDRHTVTLSLIDAPFPFFRLDSADYGQLDVDVLGF
jgi:hypothetical protein